MSCGHPEPVDPAVSIIGEEAFNSSEVVGFPKSTFERVRNQGFPFVLGHRFPVPLECGKQPLYARIPLR